MKPVDRKAFAAIVTGLAELHGKTLSTAMLDMYWLAMQAWSIEDFKAAATHLANACQFMPKPYDFEQLRKAGRPTAGEAWAAALRHAASSAYRNGPLGVALTDAAVRAIGGYVAIAMCDEDKTHFLERRFAEHYGALQDAEDTREAVPQIAGPARLGSLIGPISTRTLLTREAGRA